MPPSTPPLRRVPALALAGALLLAAGAASAHHGWGSYDSDHPLTLTGPITSVAFEQPHVSLRMDADGKAWTVVLAPISRMEARGATADVVKAGRTVTAYGYPSREINDEMRAERITIDGRTFELR